VSGLTFIGKVEAFSVCRQARFVEVSAERARNDAEVVLLNNFIGGFRDLFSLDGG
jgi:hypothetical protein